MWWVFALLTLGFRARDESRARDVALEIDAETGNEILVWKFERGIKTRQGQTTQTQTNPLLVSSADHIITTPS